MAIKKIKFVNYINKELKNSITYIDVLAVVNILIKELVKELKIGNKIKIGNFGTFRMVPLKSKKIRNISSWEMTLTKPSKSLRFILANKFVQYLMNKEK